MFKSLPVLLCDFYKIAHRLMAPDKTESILATWTPRASRMAGVSEVVVFGNQIFTKEFLVDFFNANFFNRPKAEVVAEYIRVIRYCLGVADPDASHIADLHDLGYLPLLIKALPEGTVIPLRVPAMTIVNTDKRFFWVTTYVETLASCELWLAYNSATIAHEFRKQLDQDAMETVGTTDFVPFQGHDFSFRGMGSVWDAVKSGMGHLTSFVGTDTIPAILAAEYFYDADIETELVGTSIPASEHSVQCAYGDDMAYLDRLITEVHPTGYVSIVCDGYDFWDVIGRVVPALKDKIMARDGKVVLRPDSGDPVLILCGDPDAKTELERKGAVEALWDIFRGTISEQGYKILNYHIGLIYGDAITRERAREIAKRLKAKGFASINVVFGIGSFTYQYNTRDSLGFAVKAVNTVIDGTEIAIFKDPVTDDGTKKSQRGAVVVLRGDDGTITYKDGLTLAECEDYDDLLVPIFHNSQVLNRTTFSEIRGRLEASRSPALVAA